MCRFLTVITLLFGLCQFGYAEVPVVDDSENLALLEEQSIYPSAPSAPEDESFAPLVKDDGTLPASLEQSNVLNNKIQHLQQELAELRGRFEEQAHALKALQEQQLSLYRDLDSRIPAGHQKALNIQPVPMPDASVANTESPSDAVSTMVHVTAAGKEDEQSRYLAAVDKLKNKQYSDALLAMNEFVHDFPDGNYAVNAHYWLGELYLHQHQYKDAMTHFDVVLAHPTANKYSASLLKKAYVLAATDRAAEAKKLLQDIIRHYPDTPVAALARKKLSSMGD